VRGTDAYFSCFPPQPLHPCSHCTPATKRRTKRRFQRRTMRQKKRRFRRRMVAPKPLGTITNRQEHNQEPSLSLLQTCSKPGLGASGKRLPNGESESVVLQNVRRGGTEGRI